MNDASYEERQVQFGPGRETYIVRLWTGAGTGRPWRLVAEHVRTGRSVSIHSLSELVAFFEDQLPPADQLPPPAAPGLR